MLKFKISAASSVGCVRRNNEDMLLIGNSTLRTGELDAELEATPNNRFIIALADGMGGHNSGEVASNDVLTNLQFFYNDLPNGLATTDFNEMIYEWLASINNILESKGRSDERYRDMGTTLVAIAYYEGEFYWMNCGDSRYYSMNSKGELHQISTDHSLNNLLGKREHSNVITNCIGGGCKTSYIDLVRCTPDIVAGDTLLLCSDGLTDMVSDDTIQQMLADGCEASALCHVAEDAGGFDNVSAVIIRVS